MRFMQSPANQPTLVVGAAIVRDSRVLATRRTRPVEAAGLWEFPGGKVEPGEDAEAALVREIREELRCEVRVTGALSGEQPIGDGLTLRVLLAELTAERPRASRARRHALARTRRARHRPLAGS